MTRTANIDPPPPGPIRWRWVTAAFASLLRAARIISPDESVNIDATTGGFTLSQKEQPITPRIKILTVGDDLYETPEISVNITLVGLFYLPVQTVAIPNNCLLCIKIQYTLETDAMENPPFFGGRIDSSEISGSASVELSVIAISNLSSAQAAIPTTGPARGEIYIPIAINENGFSPLVASADFTVDVYEGAFTFATI